MFLIIILMMYFYLYILVLLFILSIDDGYECFLLMCGNGDGLLCGYRLCRGFGLLCFGWWVRKGRGGGRVMGCLGL